MHILTIGGSWLTEQLASSRFYLALVLTNSLILLFLNLVLSFHLSRGRPTGVVPVGASSHTNIISLLWSCRLLCLVQCLVLFYFIVCIYLILFCKFIFYWSIYSSWKASQRFSFCLLINLFNVNKHLFLLFSKLETILVGISLFGTDFKNIQNQGCHIFIIDEEFLIFSFLGQFNFKY